MMKEEFLEKLDPDKIHLGLHDLIVELLDSLSAVKALTEIKCDLVDEKTLIRQALAGLLQNQDMERCSFFVVTESGRLRNVTGLSVDEQVEDLVWTETPFEFSIGEGIIGAAAETGQVQYCADCEHDERFSNHEAEAGKPGCVICAPVFTLGQVLIGVLNISHPQPRYFTQWHLRLLDIYVNILGQLITNRRLFQQMELQIAARTAELERLFAETRALKDHYASVSMLDQLTGLHNRRYFYEQAGFALAQHRRYGKPFCVLVIDIDHFKSVNDRYGHVFGDKVLVAVAESLKQLMRSADILVRFGGEEFVVIFSDTGCDSGRMFAERIRQQIKTLNWRLEDKDVNLTLSVGVFCSSHDDESLNTSDIDTIIHYADTALYAAKANGRDRVEIFDRNWLCDSSKSA